jgi:tRNA 2-selenouridine synthase
MVQIINPADLFGLCKTLPIIDVRAPAEFLQGHIPGAFNLPLFDDEERKHVGTAYKQQSREAAIMTGLDYAGKKLTYYVKRAREIAPDKQILLHCWRGGMRSESMAWLLSLAGFEVFLLKGGYKAYRKTISDNWDNHLPVMVLSGKTGTGKTEILHQMLEMDQQILDLEDVAHHKGSAFGGIGQPSQPTNEQFENDLGNAWLQLTPNKPVWIEDESRSIGTVFLPDKLFPRIIGSTVIYLEMTKSLRIQRLVNDYAGYPKNLLNSSIEKIHRKLGGQHAKAAIDAIEKDDFETAADIILYYYDKSYGFNLLQRDPFMIHTIKTNTSDAKENATMILEYCNNMNLI